MRRTLIALAAAFCPVTLAAQTLTDAERADLAKSLGTSYERLAYLAETLTPGQWTFKQAEDRWSVGEVAEHILVSEQVIMQAVRGPLMENPRASAAEVRDVPTEEIMTFMRDRSQRFQAPEQAQPANRWPTQKAFLEAWKSERKANWEWVRTTDADLHGHVLENPALGMVDGVRWLAFMAAHAERHLLQIDEVMNDPKFPGKTTKASR